MNRFTIHSVSRLHSRRTVVKRPEEAPLNRSGFAGQAPDKPFKGEISAHCMRELPRLHQKIGDHFTIFDQRQRASQAVRDEAM